MRKRTKAILEDQARRIAELENRVFDMSVTLDELRAKKGKK